MTGEESAENENEKQETASRRQQLGETVGDKEARKLRARAQESDVIWFGLGMMGLVGWSVAIPTIIGVLLGVYLDRVVPMDFSWTLTLLFVGIVVGCLNAWYWVNKEADEIRRRCTPPAGEDEDGSEADTDEQ